MHSDLWLSQSQVREAILRHVYKLAPGQTQCVCWSHGPDLVSCSCSVTLKKTPFQICLMHISFSLQHKMEKSCLFVDTLSRCEGLASVFSSSVELLPPDVSKRGDLGKAAEGKDKEKRWWKSAVLAFTIFFLILECILVVGRGCGEYGRGCMCEGCEWMWIWVCVCVCVCGIMERNHIRQWKSCL